MQFPLIFKELQSLFLSFLLSNREPKISLNKLSVSRHKGGLAMSDIYQYNLSYNARYPLALSYSNPILIGSWVRHNLTNKVSLVSLWFHPIPPAEIDNLLL